MSKAFFATILAAISFSSIMFVASNSNTKIDNDKTLFTQTPYPENSESSKETAYPENPKPSKETAYPEN